MSTCLSCTLELPLPLPPPAPPPKKKRRKYASFISKVYLTTVLNDRFFPAVSPQMEIYIEEAARRSPVVDMDKEPPPGVQLSPPTHCSCLILTLDSAVPLPPLLQNHHTLPWRPCHDDRMTDSWSDNVCALFHFLVRPAKKRWATNTSDPLLVS